MVVWATTSSALRAPPMALLGRYVAGPSRPALVALMALGLGLAQALAPYVALAMKGVDPRWPFLISAATLAAVTLGMRAAERALAAAAPVPAPVPSPSPLPLPLPLPLPSPSPSPSPLPLPVPVPVPVPVPEDSAVVVSRAVAPNHDAGWRLAPVTIFLLASALAALAFQLHTSVISAPLYLRHATAAQLPALLPVFWIGFSLGLFPAAKAAKKWPPLQVMAAGALLAAFAAAAAGSQPSLPFTVAAQALAGLGWALLLASAMTAALALGDASKDALDGPGANASGKSQPGGTWGMTSSWLSAILAGAALLRLVFVATQTPTPAQVLGWAPLPAAVFGVVGLAIWQAHSRFEIARVHPR